MIDKIKNFFISNYAKEILNSQKNLIIVTKNNEAKDVNKAFLDFFGFESLKDFKEKHKCVCELFVNEEGFLSGKNWLNEILSHPDNQYKVKIIKDNKEYIFKVEATKFKDKVIVTLTDITKLVAQKEKLDEVNEILNQYKKAVDDLLIVSKTDPKGIITYVNDKFCEISGYSREELIGKSHNIIRHPDMPKEVFKNMWETIKRGEIWRGIIKNKKKDGGEYWVDAGIMPIKNHKGEIIEYIALRTDITELVKAKEKAQEAEKAKSVFLANMSHEIRTPLNAILGFAHLLEKDKSLSEKAREYLRIINSSANTLLKIINDVLDLSKLDAGEFSIEEKEFNPNKVFFDIVELFRAKAKEKNIDYQVKIDNLPNCIISDEHRIKQVLANLIGNAIKFTPRDGKILVSIEKLNEDKEKVRIRFSVKDTGIGIPKDKQRDIFRAFTQADGSITRKFGGTGLGLTIASRIVRKLGGFIEVESEEGKGSEFYFVLEFKKCKVEEEINEEKEDILYSGKVLVAEDDRFNQELIKEILNSFGLDVKLVSDGMEAISEVKNGNFDLILLDINMPKLSGIEAVKEIKKITSTPVVALTANAFKEDKESGLLAGFDEYLTKPIKIEELEAILDKYLKEESDYLSIIEKNLRLNRDTIKRLIKVYFISVNEDLSNLRKAIEEMNFDLIEEYAHKIKGSSINLRIDDVSKLAEEIEKSAREKLNINYKELFNKLIDLIEKIKERIK